MLAIDPRCLKYFHESYFFPGIHIFTQDNHSDTFSDESYNLFCSSQKKGAFSVTSLALTSRQKHKNHSHFQLLPPTSSNNISRNIKIRSLQQKIGRVTQSEPEKKKRKKKQKNKVPVQPSQRPTSLQLHSHDLPSAAPRPAPPPTTDFAAGLFGVR